MQQREILPYLLDCLNSFANRCDIFLRRHQIGTGFVHGKGEVQSSLFQRLGSLLHRTGKILPATFPYKWPKNPDPKPLLALIAGRYRKSQAIRLHFKPFHLLRTPGAILREPLIAPSIPPSLTIALQLVHLITPADDVHFLQAQRSQSRQNFFLALPAGLITALFFHLTGSGQQSINIFQQPRTQVMPVRVFPQPDHHRPVGQTIDPFQHHVDRLVVFAGKQNFLPLIHRIDDNAGHHLALTGPRRPGHRRQSRRQSLPNRFALFLVQRQGFDQRNNWRLAGSHRPSSHIAKNRSFRLDLRHLLQVCQFTFQALGEFRPLHAEKSRCIIDSSRQRRFRRLLQNYWVQFCRSGPILPAPFRSDRVQTCCNLP